MGGREVHYFITTEEGVMGKNISILLADRKILPRKRKGRAGGVVGDNWGGG